MTFDPIEERDATIAALRAELVQAQAEVERLRRDVAGQTRSAQNGWRTADAMRAAAKAAEAREVSLRKAIEALADEWDAIGPHWAGMGGADLRAALAAEPTPAAEPHAEDGADELDDLAEEHHHGLLAAAVDERCYRCVGLATPGYETHDGEPVCRACLRELKEARRG